MKLDYKIFIWIDSNRIYLYKTSKMDDDFKVVNIDGEPYYDYKTEEDILNFKKRIYKKLNVDKLENFSLYLVFSDSKTDFKTKNIKKLLKKFIDDDFVSISSIKLENLLKRYFLYNGIKYGKFINQYFMLSGDKIIRVPEDSNIKNNIDINGLLKHIFSYKIRKKNSILMKLFKRKK